LRATRAAAVNNAHRRNFIAARVVINSNHQRRMSLQPIAAVLKLTPGARIKNHRQVTLCAGYRKAMINEANLAFKRQAPDRSIHWPRQDCVDHSAQGAKRTRQGEHRTHSVAIWLEMRSNERSLCSAKPGNKCSMSNRG
jgi:hypothetical protein